MELQLSNKNQHRIADLMWKAQTTDEVQSIIKSNGKDAVIVFEMMLATFFDDQMETDMAEEILERIKNGT
jgi:hypothetical protein